MKSNLITLTLLLIASFMITSCTKPIPSSQLDLNKTMRSKVYSLEEYKALPKEKRYEGEFSIGDKEIKELESTRPFQKKVYMVEVYRSDKTLHHITELFKDKTFQKKFPVIFSDDLDILVYSPHKMFVLSTSQYYEREINEHIRCMHKVLFEIKRDIIKVHLDRTAKIIKE